MKVFVWELTLEAVDNHSAGVVEAALALAFVFVQDEAMTRDWEALRNKQKMKLRVWT